MPDSMSDKNCTSTSGVQLERKSLDFTIESISVNFSEWVDAGSITNIDCSSLTWFSATIFSHGPKGYWSSSPISANGLDPDLATVANGAVLQRVYAREIQ